MPVTLKRKSRVGEAGRGTPASQDSSATPRRETTQSRLRGIVARISPISSRLGSRRPTADSSRPTTRYSTSSPLKCLGRRQPRGVQGEEGDSTRNTPSVRRSHGVQRTDSQKSSALTIRKPLWTMEGKGHLKRFLQHRRGSLETTTVSRAVEERPRFIRNKDLVMRLLKREQEIFLSEDTQNLYNGASKDGAEDPSATVQKAIHTYVLQEHDIEVNQTNLSWRRFLNELYQYDAEVQELISRLEQTPSSVGTPGMDQSWPDAELRCLNGKTFQLSWIYDDFATQTTTKALCVFVASRNSPLFELSVKSGGLRALVTEFGRRGHAHFLCVYVRDADTDSEEELQVRLAEARLLMSMSTLNLMTFSSAVKDSTRIPVVVDPLGSPFNKAFAPGPECAYILRGKNVHFISSPSSGSLHDSLKEELQRLL